MGHLKYNSSTGHLLYGANGHLVHECCPCPGTACEHCTCTPDELTLTISGVTLSTACISRDGAPTARPDSSRITSWAGNVNGTHLLTQHSACEWRKTLTLEVGPKYISAAGTTDCSGARLYGAVDAFITVIRTATKWEIRVGQYAVSCGWGDVFRGDITADCDTGGTVSNSNTRLHLGAVNAGLPCGQEPAEQATGGSATLELCDQTAP